MGDIKKEAFSKQLYINDGKYLDAKMQPVDNIEDLYAIPRTQRFIGLEIMVINEGKKYILMDGTKDSNWQPLSNGELYWEGDVTNLDINE